MGNAIRPAARDWGRGGWCRAGGRSFGCARDRFGGFLANTGQVLQQAPVGQAIFVGAHQHFAGVALLVKVLDKAPFATGKVDEGDRLFALHVKGPILIHIGVALKVEPFAHRLTFAGIVDQKWESATFHRHLGPLRRFVIADAMFGLTGGEDADQRWPFIFVGFHADAVEVIHVRGCGLGHIDIRVHHGDLGDLLARFRLARFRCAMRTHLGRLAGEGAGGRLTAGVGINLRVQHQNLDVHAAG